MRTMLCKATGILSLLLLTAGSLGVQAADDPREADHEALRALIVKVTQAINSQGIAALESHMAKDFVFTTIDQTVLTDAASIKAYYDRMLRSDDSRVTSFSMAPKAGALTKFIDANTGYCYGTSEDTYVVKSDGRTVMMPSSWTATVVAEDGRWKIAAVHTGANVLDNPVLDAVAGAAGRGMLLAGVIAGLLGVIVGALVGKRLGKKPSLA